MITFKLLQFTDVDVVIKMMQEFYAIDAYSIEIDASKKMFEEFLSNNNLGKCWLIYNYTEIVGYAIITFIFSFEYKGKMAFFEELFIRESARGLGIGNKAVAFIKKEAKQSNVKMMYLEVENHNAIAQKLYLANDFVIHNRQIMKFKF